MRPPLHRGAVPSRVNGEMPHQNNRTYQKAAKANKKDQINGPRELTNDERNVSMLPTSPKSVIEGNHGMSSSGGRSEQKRDSEDEQSNTKRMAVGTPVYIRDPHYSWVPATIQSEADEKKHVKVKIHLPSDWEDYTVLPDGRGARDMKLERVVKLADYGQSGKLPLQNLEKDGVTVTEKDDIADLANLHMAAILYSLKARHAKSLPYTRVRDIIVAVNPFRWINGLYSEEKQNFYAKNLIWRAQLSPRESIPMNGHPHVTSTTTPERDALGNEYEKLGMSPHVYEISSLAYLGLARDQIDQTVIVTGESGAGKSETIKIVMNHLATVERSRPSWPESDRDVAGGLGSVTVKRILQANPLFESFGNAKTVRNDNSSRFGKFTQLLFDTETASQAEKGGRAVPSCHIAGSKCITYLLEKSRVVSASEGERTFHIFYQLLGAQDDDKQKIWGGLIGASTSDFSYLSNTSLDCANGLASGASWPDTIAALSVFGIHGDMFVNVMRSLCIILQLGNIVFDGELCDGEERAVISSVKELEKLSSILGVPKADIETALTKRFMTTRGEELTIFLKVNEARDGCDALAKEIYARVFDLLVKKCNDATQPDSSHAKKYGNISLLDIFGFENFSVNRFEQFCINYANEKLQQKYVMDNFEAIRLECEEEGVSMFDISLVDNTDVVELLEGKIGLFAQLNDECAMKNGIDENFVRKFKQVNSISNHIVLDHRDRRYEFGIKHYAAPTKYDARTFIERNLDKIPTELLKCASQSSNSLIREEFQQLSSKMEAPKPRGGLKRRSEMAKHLVVTKFKDQLTSLMFLIDQSRTRYIRCVKPNKQMTPRMLDHSHTVSQLESAGLVTAIVMASESFPNWLSFPNFIDRFGFLGSEFGGCRLDSRNIKTNAETLLNHLLASMNPNNHRGTVKPFSCGKTRVYFRAGVLELIETARQDHYAGVAIQFQAFVRSYWARQRFLMLKRGMILLQQKVRRWLGHEQHAAMSLRLQRWMRSYWMRQKFLAMRQSAPLLQCQIRCWIVCKSYMRTIQKVVTIQCFVRKSFAEKELSRWQKRRASAVLIQTRWRGVKSLREFKTACQAAIKIQCFHRMVTSRTAVAMKREKERNRATESKILHEELATLEDIKNEILHWQRKFSSRNIASRMDAPRKVAPRKTYHNAVATSSAKWGDIRKPVGGQREIEGRSRAIANQEQTQVNVVKTAEEYFKPWGPKEHITNFCKRLDDRQKQLKIDKIIISDSDKLNFFIEQMHKSNKFEHQEMTKWRNKTDVDKTWDAANIFFHKLVDVRQNKINHDKPEYANKLFDVEEISVVSSSCTIKQSRHKGADNTFSKDVPHLMSEEKDTFEPHGITIETESTNQTWTVVAVSENNRESVFSRIESGEKTAAESGTEGKDSHGTSSQTKNSETHSASVVTIESRNAGKGEVSGTESGKNAMTESYKKDVSEDTTINEAVATSSLADETIKSELSQIVLPKTLHSSPAGPVVQEAIDTISRNSFDDNPEEPPFPQLTAPPECQIFMSRDGSDSTTELMDIYPQEEVSHENSQPKRTKGWRRLSSSARMFFSRRTSNRRNGRNGQGYRRSVSKFEQ